MLKDQSSALRLNELRNGLHLIARPKQRSHNDAIDVGICGQGL